MYSSRSLGQTEKSATFLAELFFVSLAPTMHANERKSNNDGINTMAWQKEFCRFNGTINDVFSSSTIFSRTLNMSFKWKKQNTTKSILNFPNELHTFKGKKRLEIKAGLANAITKIHE